MNLKKVKSIINKKKYIKFLNPNFNYKFSNVDFFIIKKENNVDVIELNYYNKEKKIELLNKDRLKELKLKKYKKYYQVFKLKEEKDFKPEKLMKLGFFKELMNNYPEGSIISEYTHTNLKSRADFAVFTNGECHVFELKSKQDNLSKLKKQVKEYKKYANKIFIVINERHYKKYLTLGLKNVNLIIETDSGFIVKELSEVNVVNKNLSHLLWHKEKEHLFSYVKNQKDYSLSEKMRKLKTIVDINQLTFRVLEERYKLVSDHCRINYMSLFESREFSPSKKNIKYFIPDVNMNFLNIVK